MKAKVLVLIVVCAVITLSFTVTTVKKHHSQSETSSVANSAEPAGGMASADPIE